SRLGDVPVSRPLVLEVLAAELVEEAHLSEHRADSAHLEHQPLQRPEARGLVRRKEASGLAGEVDQDRARLEELERLAARSLRIQYRRDLAVGIEREKLGRALLAPLEAHPMRLVRQAGLLEHDRDLHP